MMLSLSIVSCVLALIPALLFVSNLKFYRPLESADRVRRSCSVLIPARNEESNIREALQSVLRSTGIDFEVIVLDDSSADRTAEIVTEFASRDPRVRLKIGKPLPDGWSGKNFACQQLADAAKQPLLVFMDADVRIMDSRALARLAGSFEVSGVSLISGVPLEETHTFMERLIIPLIHFVLLGFLPMGRMRKTTDPRFAAACGQILAVRKDAYQRSGGHSAIAGCVHDALALARSFRRHDLSTDLFDATDSFRCRMYKSGREVLTGFAKNAQEGLAQPQLILGSTMLLLGGQVLPVVLFLVAPGPLTLLAITAAFLPRLIAVVRFRQSPASAILHPAGIVVLLAIQWFAFLRFVRKGSSVWKGRVCPVAAATLKLIVFGWLVFANAIFADPAEKLGDFQLSDQFSKPRSYHFPKEKVTVMSVADHEGSKQLADWISQIYARYEKRVDIDGIADVSMIPSAFQGVFRSAFQKQLTRSVMLDWTGEVVKQFGYEKGLANLYVIDRRGHIMVHVSGPLREEAMRKLSHEIDRALKGKSKVIGE